MSKNIHHNAIKQYSVTFYNNGDYVLERHFSARTRKELELQINISVDDTFDKYTVEEI